MRWPPWSCFNIKCHWDRNSHNIKMRWSHGHLLFILKGIQIPWKMASYWNMVLSSRIPLHDHPLDACSAPLPWQPVMLPGKMFFILRYGHVQQDTNTILFLGWLLCPITMAACNVAMAVCWDWWSASTRHRVDDKAMEYCISWKIQYYTGKC